MFCRHCGEEIEDTATICPECGGAQIVVGDARDGLKDSFTGARGISPGDRLMDRYEIVREIGRGGMGVVYLARDNIRNRDVALKFPPAQLQHDRVAINQLRDEVNTSLDLSHENICRVYDLQQTDGLYFISMEYVDGLSLEDLLDKQRKSGQPGFPLEQVLDWLKPICEALDYAHEKGIVHRDLKPGNVLVSSEDRVKLADFGLARSIRSSMSKYSREAMSGTILYMSPEQVIGRNIDHRSDIYGLGMMTYELLTGKAPFATAADIAYCQQYMDVEPISNQPSHINLALATVCDKCKERRPARASEFLVMLQDTGAPPEPDDKQIVQKTETDTLPKVGEERTIEIAADVLMQFVWIPPGEFMMGSEDGPRDEKPLHRVLISKGFWFGKYEVTQAQWQSVMDSNPSRYTGEESPVERVSWQDCKEFLARLAQSIGERFRLPTEAEWEYACRAGTTTSYCFGNDVSGLGDYAWYSGNRKGVLGFGGKTKPVGLKKPNAWGLCDMHGSVWEWCEDWYDKNSYKESPTEDPCHDVEGSGRVLRGGGWYSSANECRSAYRFACPPAFTHLDFGSFGLRVVCAPYL